MRSDPDPAGFPFSVPRARRPDHQPAEPLSPSRMKEIARAIAARPGLWEPVVRMDPASRWHQRLRSAAGYDVWLESWLPGQDTGWHDHAGTSGVLVVARGELEERVSVLNGVFTQVRHIPEGAARRMGRRGEHNLTNVSLAPAVSVHVYSPPLGATRGYKIGAMGLMRSPWNASSQN